MSHLECGTEPTSSYLYMAANQKCISPETTFVRSRQELSPLPKIPVDTEQGSWDSARGKTGWKLVLFEGPSMDSEKDLIEAFETVVHRDFPNPERVGCPGREVLAELARLPTDAHFAHFLEHVTKCGPCFDELKELHKKRFEVS